MEAGAGWTTDCEA